MKRREFFKALVTGLGGIAIGAQLRMVLPALEEEAPKAHPVTLYAGQTYYFTAQDPARGHVHVDRHGHMCRVEVDPGTVTVTSTMWMGQ